MTQEEWQTSLYVDNLRNTVLYILFHGHWYFFCENDHFYQYSLHDFNTFCNLYFSTFNDYITSLPTRRYSTHDDNTSGSKWVQGRGLAKKAGVVEK